MAKAYNRYATLRYLIDIPLLLIAYWGALAIGNRQLLPNSVSYYLFSLIILGAWFMSGIFSKVYTDKRSDKFSEQIVYIFYNLFLFGLFLSSASYFLKNYVQFSIYFFPLLMGNVFVLLTLAKYIIRKYIHVGIYKGKLFDNILVVGATAAAYDFYETINKYYYYGYKCVGFLDNSTFKLNGAPYLGNIENLGNVLKQRPIDEVIIALPSAQHQQIHYCMEVCDSNATKARIIPDLSQYTSASTQVNNIGLLPVINVRPLPLDKLENKLLKRSFDIFFSLCFFAAIGIWLLPLIALLIRLTSKGPSLFKQERWGLNNKRIVCYKFRTMVAASTDTDASGAYLQATKDDPRVTKLGRYLRKTNLDELPQFWNVLMGSMSVVGPRPHPTPLNLESIHVVENYMMRHMVKPGISGWAQVNGCRGETKQSGSMQRRVNFDLYYIHRWTFGLDMQIILQTVINIIRGDQNAY
ncbi:undecaprenyl-phosphate glucose phosphotransferase [Deminuibacter soli]|uniref:Undecaprenyl-phosphate glucose phosphotransferase n=1 Tax=Deminuibacter soli TaxID=2291815 RepID=A0A3E1NFQ9_9BACT|nr:undecaprenyl-phosphate glucose phosphotransferase [Deminuibacter soli]RFM26651.1 undecaprenyl-phosphate glucose phosphotransferase [Deminuibacter soli]